MESDAVVVVDRLMTWDRRGYGSHAESGIAAAATRWYLAEGVTGPGMNLFYLVQNPGTQAAAITVDFLRPSPAGPVSQSYLVAPRSRLTIWVNMVPGLGTTDVSADIRSTNGVPIVVERAMYLDRPGEPLGAGHAAAGVTQASTTWFLAEGATGDFFDEYVLIANPSDQAAADRRDLHAAERHDRRPERTPSLRAVASRSSSTRRTRGWRPRQYRRGFTSVNSRAGRRGAGDVVAGSRGRPVV